MPSQVNVQWDLPSPKAGALLGATTAHDATIASFQSSPDPRAGRCSSSTAGTIASTSNEFQSSPDPGAGRCLWDVQADPAGSTFQSSPDPGPGAATLSGTVAPARLAFQSSPDPGAGRCSYSAARRRRFQS